MTPIAHDPHCPFSHTESHRFHKEHSEGRKVTAKYKGKITGDTVKGKVESDWSGDWQTLDWEGTRGK